MIESWQSDLDHLKWIQQSGISFANKKLLDLGCGSGFVCERAMLGGAIKAVGIDLVKPSIAEELNWTFVQQDLDSIDWDKAVADAFDYILAFDIIEHVEAPFRFLRSCHNLLCDSGVLILTTPNLSSWERIIKPTSWSGVRDEQHKTLFNKYSLEFTLRRAGFRNIQLAAPIRKLSFLGPLQPHFGGQIFCRAGKD